MKVVVIGSGIAGTAAALTLRDKGAEVVLVRGAAGASMLAPGILDGEMPLDHGILDSLGIYALGDAIVATSYGILRKANGIDRGILDLAKLPKGNVLVPDIEREGWDGPLLARGLGESPIAKARGLAFVSAPAQLILQTSDRVLPDADIAGANDEPARIAQLAERIRAVVSGHVAVLLPPWLGIDAPRAEALSKAVGVPCGEIAIAPSSPAGFRFARARDRAFEKAGVLVVSGFAEAIEVDGDALVVRMPDADSIRASAVVVAIGGIAAGGIHYLPGEASLATALPRAPRPVFASSIKGAGTLGWDGEPVLVPGSLFGIPPESLAWPYADPAPLERVGILRGTSPENVVVAGDAMADATRSFLGALRSGVEAALSLGV